MTTEVPNEWVEAAFTAIFDEPLSANLRTARLGLVLPLIRAVAPLIRAAAFEEAAYSGADAFAELASIKGVESLISCAAAAAMVDAKLRALAAAVKT